MKKSFLLILLFTFLNTTFSQKSELTEQADQVFKDKKHSQASKLYTKALTQNIPEERHYVLYKRAYAYYELKDSPKANEDARKALRIKKKNDDFKFVKGNSYWLLAKIESQKGNFKKETRLYKKALKYIKTSQLYTNIGFSKISQNKNKEAIEYFEKALTENPMDAYAFSNKALAHLNLGNLTQARKDIRKSIELDDTNPYAYKHSAMIYLKEGHISKACPALYKAVELDYENFSDEYDKNEVNDLIIKHCKMRRSSRPNR